MPDLALFQEQFGAALAQAEVYAETPLSRALTIHRNTAHRAAQTALADNYPVVLAMVGQDAFEGLAFDFVEAMPPDDPRLSIYGAALPAFFANYAPFVDYPYLADVARVERLVVEALFAADADVRDAASFATLDLEVALQLHPAVRTASLAWPGGSLWLAHQDNAPADALNDIIWQPECVLVTRPGNRILVAVETLAATAFIEACADGQPLSIAAGAAGDTLADVFARAISAGCFV
jgi:Putative DNA-binding domain